jgi:nucleoside phosphorylase
MSGNGTQKRARNTSLSHLSADRTKRPRDQSPDEVSRRQFRYEDYTVGWISALPLELAAAEGMLDEVHESLLGKGADSNAYMLGSIGQHNVVLACLPKDGIGANNAATVGAHMLGSFPSITWGLMVGVGGGAPGVVDVRLGDIVVGD